MMVASVADFFIHVRGIEPPSGPVRHDHFVVAGCSNSAGVGVAAHERYSKIIERKLGIAGHNVSVPGGCATIASVYLSRWLTLVGRPKFAIAQWPNAMRLPVWTNDGMRVENASDRTDIFLRLLDESEENFWAEWLRSVITTNLLYQAAGVPIINVYLDPLPQKYRTLLRENNIIVHDDAEPGTWQFDGAASDGKHHSAACHDQWATKIIGIINEFTTR